MHEQMQRFLKPMFEKEICTTMKSQGLIISFFCLIGPFTAL